MKRSAADTAASPSRPTRVVTPSWKKSLRLAVNGGEATEIPLPFTVGMWDSTEPLEVELAAGRNVLRVTRQGEAKGVTIKDFPLTPTGASAGNR